MRAMLIGAAAIIAMVVTFVAVADPALAAEKPYNGIDLLEGCRVVASGASANADSSLHAGICLGEIEALNWNAPDVSDDNFRSCAPQGVTRQELAAVVVKFLDRNPDRQREPFETLALDALAHIWPCQTRQTSWYERLFGE
ncbi:MAG: Rap1a/Tai family immunity protein [Xanthobacteraceae bacterium]